MAMHDSGLHFCHAVRGKRKGTDPSHFSFGSGSPGIGRCRSAAARIDSAAEGPETGCLRHDGGSRRMECRRDGVEPVRICRELAAVILFLALAVPAAAHPRPLHWIKAHKLQICADALIIGASALDAASTRSALAHGNYEANPLYGARPSLARLLIVKAAFAVPVALSDDWLDRRTRGQPLWRRSEILLPAAILSVPQIWAAHHNWTLDKSK